MLSEVGKKESILIEPLYGYSRKNGKPHKPSIHEVINEWLNCLNFIKDGSKKVIPIWLGFHSLTFFCFLIFLTQFNALSNWLIFLFMVIFLGTVYNTIWYHRYCSHRSFEFSHKFWPLIFLWLNPSVLREESYAIPHQIHHQISDKAGDPYGPHLGWFGSYFSFESLQKFNTNISAKRYAQLKKNINHIGLFFNSYAAFRKHGSFENEVVYIIRTIFAQIIWVSFFYFLGGIKLVVAWYAAMFIFCFLMRDFNWWGHGGNFRYQKKNGWEFYNGCRALNQHFYGYIAGEWHDNHHLYPASANNAFLPGQLDLSFLIIKLMRQLGIVKSYFDFSEKFKTQYANNCKINQG